MKRRIRHGGDLQGGVICRRCNAKAVNLAGGEVRCGEIGAVISSAETSEAVKCSAPVWAHKITHWLNIFVVLKVSATYDIVFAVFFLSEMAELCMADTELCFSFKLRKPSLQLLWQLDSVLAASEKNISWFSVSNILQNGSASTWRF